MNWNKALHNFNYWTCPYYMLICDFRKAHPESFDEIGKYLKVDKLANWMINKINKRKKI